MHGCAAGHRRTRLLALALMALAGALPATAYAHDEPPAGQVQETSSVTHVDTPAELRDTDIQATVAAAWLSPEGAMTAEAAPPATWCGQARSSDDTADAASPASTGQFKIIYVYPADRPNRFAQWAGVLQANASLAESYVSLQPGSTRAPRFDMGTSCGPQYLDIQTVQLPGPRSAYVDNFWGVRDYVRQVVDQSPGGPRNYFLLNDTLGSGLAANATVPGDDRPGADNPANAGGQFGMMWIEDTRNPPASGPMWPSAMLHEMSHEMGAVQGSAAHTTFGFHCWDGADLMCYNDGASAGAQYTLAACGTGGYMATFWTLAETYDCNQDDYFSAAPAAGSYLDLHWNLYRSAFMGECSDLSTCATIPAPVPTTAPVVTRSGQTLQTTAGAWNGATAFRYAWQRCQNGVCRIVTVPSPASGYAITSADIGSSLRSVVTASNDGGGSADSPSAQTAPVAPPPVSGSVPQVSGSASNGATLTTTAGTWTNGSIALSYAWQRCNGAACSAIAGETAPAYTVQSADGNFSLRSVVTASNESGSASATSAQTSVVPAPPSSATAPTITGAAAAGAPLTAAAGTWTGSPSFAYRWQRNTGAGWADIAGATNAAYTLVTADIGATVRVQVTATNGLGAVTATSVATAPVGAANTSEAGYQAAVAASAPAVWLKFDDAGGSATVRNSGSAGSAMDMARTGNVALSTSGYQTGSKAAAFGSGNDYLQQTSTSTSITGTFTVELLRRQTSATGAPLSTRQSADLGYEWQCSTLAGNCGQVVGTGASWLTTNGSFATTALDDAGWHHVAAVVTPSGFETYVDGVQTGSGSWSGTPIFVNATHRLTLGGSFNGGSVLQEKYAGLMDEVAVYPTALSAATIAAHSAAAGLAPALPVVPVSTAAPAVSGSAMVGATLTAARGTWTGTSVTYTQQWQRNSGAGWADIAGATATTYALAAGDAGATIRVQVSATNAAGTATASSPATAAVTAAPANTTAPSITGTASAGSTLTADPGTWTGASSFAYQWQRNSGAGWADIAGATSATYALVSADVGATVRVQVAAGPTAASSSATATVVAVNTTAPSISGPPSSGATLTADPGTWTGASSFAYQWQRNSGAGWADIAGATSASYALGAGDVGATIRVQVSAGSVTVASGATATIGAVTATEAGYQAAVAASAPAAWYRFDDTGGSLTVKNYGSAGTAMDLARTGNVALSIAGYQPGSKAAAFGAATDYLQQKTAGTSITGTFTVELLRRQTSATGAPLSTRQTADLGYEWQCSTLAGNCGQVVGTGTSWLTTNGSFATTALDDAGWHHVAAVVTPAGYTTYVDGVQTGTGTWSGTPIFVNATHKLTLGGSFNGGSVLQEKYVGSMDEVAVYPTALNAAAIAAHATAGGFSATGGGGGATAVNTAAPSVAGTASLGSTLTAAPGTWTGASSYAYQWQRNTGASWADIAGATGTTYALAAADVGATIRVQVSAGATSALSPATSTVTAVAPVNSAAPAVSGSPASGATLSATPGTWTGASSLAYRWQRNTAAGWADIASATSATYTLVAADVGATVRVQVTATNVAGSTTASSSATATIGAVTATEAGYQAAVAASAPAAWYRFDDAGGSLTVKNYGSAGTAMDLARTGNVALSIAGNLPSSRAAAFGAATDYLQQKTAGTAITGTFTVEMIRAQTSATGAPLSTRQPADLGYEWQCAIAAGNCGQVAGTGTSWLTVNGSLATTALDAGWHHVAAVVTPTGYTTYVDGAQTATGTWSGTPIFVNATHKLTLGGSFNGGATLQEKYTGAMDEVAVYPSALSAATIAAHATAGGF